MNTLPVDMQKAAVKKIAVFLKENGFKFSGSTKEIDAKLLLAKEYRYSYKKGKQEATIVFLEYNGPRSKYLRPHRYLFSANTKDVVYERAFDRFDATMKKFITKVLNRNPQQSWFSIINAYFYKNWYAFGELSVAKIVIQGFRSISAASMKIGSEYRIWLHKTPCIESNAVRVKLISRPECPIRDMNENDEYVLSILDENNESDGEIILKRNSDAPYFPVSPFKGKSGKITPSRVTVLEKIQ